jgi:predicted nucleic acid-binding protein
MRVLLDTCVLSEIRKPQGLPQVKEAVKNLNSSDLFVSVMTIGEITKGMLLLRESKKKTELTVWLEGLIKYYASSILPIEVETVSLWGELTATAQKQGKMIFACDGLIAATAKQHGLHLMTRNSSDFEASGVMLVNPWNDKRGSA